MDDRQHQLLVLALDELLAGKARQAGEIERHQRAVGIHIDVRVKDLTDTQVAAIQNEITKRYRIEGALRKEVTMNIKRLQEIGSYRGERHKKGLPVRGQRTKTNARTKRGGSRGTVANKKKAPSKK